MNKQPPRAPVSKSIQPEFRLRAPRVVPQPANKDKRTRPLWKEGIWII